jgi:hypothetical protein
MSLLFLLEIAKARKLVTVTAPVGASTWTAPAGVTRLESLVGKGGSGNAAYSDPDVQRSFTVASVVSSASGAASNVPYDTYSNVWAFMQNVQSQVNTANYASGGNTGGKLTVTVYTNNSYDETTSGVNWTRPVPNTAVISTVGIPTSGNITYGASGTGTITYTSSGLSHSATTGANTTGFGKTFAGGSGGPAGSASYANVPVVAGTVYNLSVASGGSLVFTYLQ